jgi:DNA polymerase III epsilon subunit-like protein
MKLFFDTETTGKADMRAPYDAAHQPFIVQLGALLTDDDGTERGTLDVIIEPEVYEIPREASDIHGITTEIAARSGVPIANALSLFAKMLAPCDEIVAHNIEFDRLVILAAMSRLRPKHSAIEFPIKRMLETKSICTMLATTDICKIPGNYGKYKWPKLIEAHQHLFGEGFDGAHDAMADVRACKRIYFEITKPCPTK